MDYKPKKAFFWVLIENLSLLGLQFISITVLSRILLPYDYGLLGIVNVFLSLSNMLVDSGMGGALIRKNEVSRLDYSTLFVYNLFVSFLLYILLFLLSTPIGDFYGKAEVADIIRIISFIIIINAITITQNVKLIKEAKFKLLALASFFGSIFGLLVAIILAVKGFGVWALVYQQLSFSIVRMLLLLLFSKNFFSFSFSKDSFKYQFFFGVNLLYSNILNVIYANISTSVIAKIDNVYNTGLYVQANRLQLIPGNIINSVIDKVTFPIFSAHKDLNALKKNFVIYFKILLYVVFFIVAFVFLFNKEIVLLLLGDRWIGVAHFLKILIFICIGTFVQSIIRNVFKALGNTKIIAKLETLKVFISFLLIMVGVWYKSIDIIAYSLVFTSILLSIIMLVKLSCVLDFNVREQIKLFFLPIVVVSISTIFVKYTYLYFFSIDVLILKLLIGFIEYLFIFSFLVLLFDDKDITKKIKLRL